MKIRIQIGGILETQQMLDFCSKHNIQCNISLSQFKKSMRPMNVY